MFVEHKEVGEVKVLDAIGKVLLCAADHVEKFGLSKYIPLREDGRACTAGAISQASAAGGYNHNLYHGAMQRMAHALGFENNHQVCGWNNAPERTQAEVVAKLRAVALGG